MIWVGRRFRFLAELAAMAIAIPWLLFQLAVLLLLASGAVIVTFMLIRGLILGEAVVTDPTSVAGRLEFLVMQLAFWALAVRFWAYLHGFDHLFARRGNSHGSACFSSKAERTACRTGWMPIAADMPAGALNGSGSATEALQEPEAAQEAGEPPERRRDAVRAISAPALFLLDEFAALGRLEAVERGMGRMAGYGIQLWPILQDLSQLRDLYGARAGTFLANAAVQQVFGVNDFDTAKWLSESIGKETAYGQSESHQPVILAEKLRYYADPEFENLFMPQPA